MLKTYLEQHFFSKEQLLSLSNMSEMDFFEWQSKESMPTASYVLTTTQHCDSFFGKHENVETCEYYAKGYSFWLGVLTQLKVTPFDYFKNQYEIALTEIKNNLIRIESGSVNNDFESHVAQEWKYFLDGTYGLCTRTGLPRDIAVKEYAIEVIKSITHDLKETTLSANEIHNLTKAVMALDHASAPFAPHERLSSSRQKYIVNLINQYGLVIE